MKKFVPNRIVLSSTAMFFAFSSISHADSVELDATTIVAGSTFVHVISENELSFFPKLARVDEIIPVSDGSGRRLARVTVCGSEQELEIPVSQIRKTAEICPEPGSPAPGTYFSDLAVKGLLVTGTEPLTEDQMKESLAPNFLESFSLDINYGDGGVALGTFTATQDEQHFWSAYTDERISVGISYSFEMNAGSLEFVKSGPDGVVVMIDEAEFEASLSTLGVSYNF